MLEALSTSPLLAGCVMLMMNLGGKYVILDIPKGMDAFFAHPWVRKFTVFCIAFMATRSIKTALLLLLLFILLSRYLLNEKSKSCIPGIRERVEEAMAEQKRLKKEHEDRVDRVDKGKKKAE